MSLFFSAMRQIMYPEPNQTFAFVSAAMLAEKLTPLLEERGWTPPA